ncbi:DUF1963 domain-containing protein [Bradyrhizobium aeschynomenes]|uniref:DUF1963 domain-containing protein n=1 Tax=Bradyrhizobium aeschynomenes TaxID=2734909 RepID=UPI001554A992|nr:DUF1963 domain-containing protein [Bradyrhizobium aeschynomenes]NPV24100.1 DUF1963 domain-containing protein [Bradyrhizobium aeschynomenes]
MSIVFLRKPAAGRTRVQSSVILRRQVPIRFDEPARSWLGGLPQMPDNVAWPRTRSGPMHFLAQIACADLPAQIWHGRGPRDGWLLLFVDVLQMEDEDDEENRLSRVLHIDQLGPERQPPADMPTVRHALADHIGQFAPEMRAGVPKLWRRWPIDLVVQPVPAPPAEDDESDWEPVQVTGAELYGAPEDEERIDRIAQDEPRPLTRRGALYLVERVMHRLSAENDRRRPAKALQPGWLAQSIAALQASVETHEAGVAQAAAQLQECPPHELSSRQQYLDYQRDLHAAAKRKLADLVALTQPMTEDALAAEIARAGQAHVCWLERQLAELEDLKRQILTQDLDAMLDDDGWAAMKAAMTAARSEYWMWWSDPPTDLRKVCNSLLDYAQDGLQFALREDLLDLYTRSAAARDAIPEVLRARLEPKLRSISRSTTPHRMGGPRDVLQNSADAADDDLLFQLGSDDAMGWMWGDMGALLIYLHPSSLKTGRLKRAYAEIDSH